MFCCGWRKFYPNEFLEDIEFAKNPYLDGVDRKDFHIDIFRVAGLISAVLTIQKNKVKGDFAELGVYRGAFASFISQCIPDKNIWLFDTFEGFSEQDYEAENEEERLGLQNFSREILVRTSVEKVLENMPNDERCIIRKGYFPDSAQDIPREVVFSLVSIDTDLYIPTLEGLKFFYKRMNKGGCILIHDYGLLKGVRRAVDEFSNEVGVVPLCLADTEGSAMIVHL